MALGNECPKCGALSISFVQGVCRACYMRDYHIMIKIEKGIPAPIHRTNGKYPWMIMDIGDSFSFPADVSISAASSMASNASKRYSPKKFNAKTSGDVIRCWRIA
jgi:hypothetical protein